jgi:hypothetical protein
MIFPAPDWHLMPLLDDKNVGLVGFLIFSWTFPMTSIFRQYNIFSHHAPKKSSMAICDPKNAQKPVFGHFWALKVVLGEIRARIRNRREILPLKTPDWVFHDSRLIAQQSGSHHVSGPYQHCGTPPWFKTTLSYANFVNCFWTHAEGWNADVSSVTGSPGVCSEEACWDVHLEYFESNPPICGDFDVERAVK